MSENTTERIRVLNDQFRKTFKGGRVTISRGVCSFDNAILARIQYAVRDFDCFSEANDPHGEHDFGNLEVAGEKIYWKIDCYDNNMEYGSEDPSDPEQTTRVLTIMLTSEY